MQSFFTEALVKRMCLIILWNCPEQTRRQKYSYSEFFWSVISHIQTEYVDLRSNSPYSVQMWENTDQKYSVYGHFSSNNVACVIVESYRYSIISLLKFYWNDFPICQLLFSTSNYQVAIFSRASTHRKPFLDRQHESKSSLLLSCQITVGVL